MENIRSMEDIEKRLNGYMEENAARIDAWKNVERLTKKDGSDFQSLGKNFKNANIETGVCGNELKVNYRYGEYGRKYGNDYIYIRKNVEDAKKPIEESRIINERFLKPYFFQNAEELFEEINKKIEVYTKQNESYKQQLEDLKEAFPKIKEKLVEVKQIIGSLPKNGLFKTSLAYALEDFVKEF